MNLTMDARTIERYGNHYMAEFGEHAKANHRLHPYRSRLLTRIIVTNSLEAHLQPTAPKDIAVYYFIAGADDVMLQYWRVSILEVWAKAILDYSEERSIVGPRRGLIHPIGPVEFSRQSLTQAERDHLYNQGYNVVHYMPTHGHIIWSDLIWRDGHPVFLNRMQSTPDEIYKHTATPLALLE